MGHFFVNITCLNLTVNEITNIKFLFIEVLKEVEILTQKFQNKMKT